MCFIVKHSRKGNNKTFATMKKNIEQALAAYDFDTQRRMRDVITANGYQSPKPMASSWFISTIPVALWMPMDARCSPRNTRNNNGCSGITNHSNGH